MVIINLGKKVSGKELEKVLLEAAKNLGFKTKIQEDFRVKYELGSVKKKIIYDGTTITLRKHFRYIGRLFFNREEDRDWLILFDHPSYSEKKIMRYLDAISEKI